LVNLVNVSIFFTSLVAVPYEASKQLGNVANRHLAVSWTSYYIRWYKLTYV